MGMKWLTKTVTPKACMAQPGPPDLLALLKRFVGEGVNNRPARIYMCCAGSLSDDKDDLLKCLCNLRREINPDAIDGDPVLPFNIVAFDPNLVGKIDEHDFFNKIATPHGSFMIDTSNEDLAALDKMLKSVQAKKNSLKSTPASWRKWRFSQTMSWRTGGFSMRKLLCNGCSRTILRSLSSR